MGSSTSIPEACEDLSPTQKPPEDPTDTQSTRFVLISSTGERYPTSRGLLCEHSKVLDDMFQICGEPVSSAAVDTAAAEVQLPDTSAMIDATVRYLDDSEDFLLKLQIDGPEDLIGTLENLVSFAHKYDMQGTVPNVWQCQCNWMEVCVREP
jgi:hypothetical protein